MFALAVATHHCDASGVSFQVSATPMAWETCVLVYHAVLLFHAVSENETQQRAYPKPQGVQISHVQTPNGNLPNGCQRGLVTSHSSLLPPASTRSMKHAESRSAGKYHTAVGDQYQPPPTGDDGLNGSALS